MSVILDLDADNDIVRQRLDKIILDERVFRVKGNNSEFIAKGIADNQLVWWGSLQQLLTKRSDLSGLLSNVLLKQKVDITKVFGRGVDYDIVSQLPIIIKEPSQEDMSIFTLNLDLFHDAISIKFLKSGVAAENNISIFLTNGLLQSAAQEAVKQFSEQKISNIIDDINRIRTEIGESFKERYLNFEHSLKDVASKLAQLQNESRDMNALLNERSIENDGSLKKMRESFLAAIADAEIRVTQSKDHAESEIRKLQDAQKELTRISPTVVLWNAKEKSHAISAIVSSIVFVLTIVSVIVFIMQYGENYASSILNLTDNKGVIVSILLIAPLIGIGWILRLVSRYFIQSITMHEDAKHRGAVAATYLGLLASEGPAAISENERAIALQALFRPAPGSNVENDIAPPNLFDLVKGKTS